MPFALDLLGTHDELRQAVLEAWTNQNSDYVEFLRKEGTLDEWLETTATSIRNRAEAYQSQGIDDFTAQHEAKMDFMVLRD